MKRFSICPSLALVAGIKRWAVNDQTVSFAHGSPSHSQNPTQSVGYPGTRRSLCIHTDFCTIWATDSVFEKDLKTRLTHLPTWSGAFAPSSFSSLATYWCSVWPEFSRSESRPCRVGCIFFFFLSSYCANKHHSRWLNEVATCATYLGRSCIWVIPYWLGARAKAFKPTPKFISGTGFFLELVPYSSKNIKQESSVRLFPPYRLTDDGDRHSVNVFVFTWGCFSCNSLSDCSLLKTVEGGLDVCGDELRCCACRELNTFAWKKFNSP